MYKVKIYVTLRESVLDPQGKAVTNSLNALHYQEVTDVRIGKYMELKVEKSDRNIHEVIDEICDKLLANPVIEDYRYEVEECVGH